VAASIDAGATPADAGVGAAGAGATPGTGATAAGEPGPQPVEPAQPPRDTPAARAVAETQADLHQVLGLILWDQKVFEELLIIDPDGVVLASTFDKHEGKTAKGLEYFENGLKATYLQPIFLSPITERLTMVISTPIRGTDLELHGVLAARLNLERFFRLINDMTGLGATGEIVVGKQNQSKGVIELMAPTRHDAQAALQRSVAVGADHSISLQEAARGLDGAAAGEKDYRDVRVLAAWEPVPSLSWGLVVKIDESEAMRPVATMGRQTWVTALILLVIVVVSAFLVSRELVRPLRALKDATDRISRGDLGVQLEIRSNDEIGELADSFERMVAAIKFFREHARRVEDDDEEETGAASPEAQ
jgi:HAMP domain-containing protein